MSMAKQHHDSASSRSKHPKGAGKRSYQKALRQAEKNGTAFYRGKNLTLQQLGGTPAALPTERKSKPQRAKPQKDEIRYLSWNAGALTTAVWEELLSLLETEPFFRGEAGSSARNSLERQLAIQQIRLACGQLWLPQRAGGWRASYGSW